jgi:signal transduction histidine kinase
MKIRNKLTFLFTFLFASLLLLFAVFIYIKSSKNRKDEYYKQLRQQAIIKANLLFDAKVLPDVLQLIYKNSQNSLLQEEVAIYDTSFKLLYHDAVDIDKVKETKQMVNEIVCKEEIRFDQGDLEAIGILYRHNNKDYVITAAAKDEYGLAKLKSLRNTLIIAFLLAIALTLIAGRFFAAKVLSPISAMVDKVQEITATNLDLRVPAKNRKDEMGELATTFNNVLDRLEKSFDAQKQFVSNVSHELRTPLSIIITELELALLKDRKNEEYTETIKSALADARKLVKLSNGLLDFAKASYDQSEISMKELRLDELVLDARESVLKSNPSFKVNIIFENEIEDDSFISVIGNEYLLKVAFINLIENGCKFSESHLCNVVITYLDDKALLRFQDKGIGIPKEDIENIFTTFYRGHNKTVATGNGIGLSLTQKIINLHKGSVSVSSIIDIGTTFTVELPHLSAQLSF